MAHDMAQAEKARAAGGVVRTSRFITPLSPDDPKILRLIRESRKNGPFQGTINEANTIHTPALRDAALGHILKHRIRYVLQTPVLVRELTYQQNDLRAFVPMISDPAKRDQMLKRIDAMTDRKD